MRKLLLLVVSILALSITLTACSGTDAAVTVVGPDEFQQTVQSNGTQVIDVRTPAEFAAGHIQGATNIDVENPAFAQQITQLEPTTTYAVYCRSGNRSKTATQQMTAAGFTHVVELDGGINAWAAAGKPVL